MPPHNSSVTLRWKFYSYVFKTFFFEKFKGGDLPSVKSKELKNSLFLVKKNK